MQITIHTGCGEKWGLGHACRMRALATALVAQGADVEFLTQTPALATFVAPYPCQNIQSDTWKHWQGDVLVQDVPSPWLSEAYVSLRHRHKVVRVDTPFVAHYSCDLLLAPCTHWDAATVAELRTAFGSRFLYGWDSVLLEQAVVHAPRLPYAERQPLLVCAAGGSDPSGVLSRIARLCGPHIPNVEWIVLVPAYGLPTAYPSWVRPEPFDRSWIRRASLLVTTWGVTCYEALWWGTPTVIVSQTEATTQDVLRLAAMTKGAVVAAGMLDALEPQALRCLVEHLCQSPPRRQQMHDASAGLLDGQGAVRAAHAILTLAKETH